MPWIKPRDLVSVLFLLRFKGALHADIVTEVLEFTQYQKSVPNRDKGEGGPKQKPNFFRKSFMDGLLRVRGSIG